MSVKILWFASLADRAGCSEERIEMSPVTPRVIYESACQRHGFSFGVDTMRVAVNGAFVGWDSSVTDGDEVVFIPPVSGG